MNYANFEFIKNEKSGTVIFQGGGISALIPYELRYEALSILYAYANSKRADEFSKDINIYQDENPFFGLPKSDLIKLALTFKDKIFVPWRYQDLDIESNYSAVINDKEINGCMPVITIKAKNLAHHLAMMVAFDNCDGFRAKLTTCDNETNLLFYKSKLNNPFFGITSYVEDTSKYVQSLICKRHTAPSFFLAIPKSYDLWISMEEKSILPNIKLLDFCIPVPVTLNHAIFAADLFIPKTNNAIKETIANSGMTIAKENLHTVAAID